MGSEHGYFSVARTCGCGSWAEKVLVDQALELCSLAPLDDVVEQPGAAQRSLEGFPSPEAPLRREQREEHCFPIAFLDIQTPLCVSNLLGAALCRVLLPKGLCAEPCATSGTSHGTATGKRSSEALPLRPGPVKAKSCTHESSPVRLCQVRDEGLDLSLSDAAGAGLGTVGASVPYLGTGC